MKFQVLAIIFIFYLSRFQCDCKTLENDKLVDVVKKMCPDVDLRLMEIEDHQEVLKELEEDRVYEMELAEWYLPNKFLDSNHLNQGGPITMSSVQEFFQKFINEQCPQYNLVKKAAINYIQNREDCLKWKTGATLFTWIVIGSYETLCQDGFSSVFHLALNETGDECLDQLLNIRNSMTIFETYDFVPCVEVASKLIDAETEGSEETHRSFETLRVEYEEDLTNACGILPVKQYCGDEKIGGIQTLSQLFFQNLKHLGF